MDKINAGLRRHNRRFGSDLKINQTHKVFEAINFIQRNRNWADGLLFAPQSWARYEYSIKEAISLLEIPVVQLLLEKEFGAAHDPGLSIFTSVCKKTFIDTPEKVFLAGYDYLHAEL